MSVMRHPAASTHVVVTFHVKRKNGRLRTWLWATTDYVGSRDQALIDDSTSNVLLLFPGLFSLDTWPKSEVAAKRRG